jgi:hypothetical protein
MIDSGSNRVVNGMEMSTEFKQRKEERREKERKITSAGIGSRRKKNVQEK